MGGSSSDRPDRSISLTIDMTASSEGILSKWSTDWGPVIPSSIILETGERLYLASITLSVGIIARVFEGTAPGEYDFVVLGLLGC